MASLSGEFRSAHKQGEKLLRARKLRNAEFWFLRAREVASYGSHPEWMALTTHRLAEIAVHRNEPEIARWRFAQALREADTKDAVAQAIIWRDRGNFELLQGNLKSAQSDIGQALRLLSDTQHENAHCVRIELIVTEGFYARTLLGGPRHDEALETLREVAVALYGYKTSAYELANLCWLISALPLTSTERHRCVIRGMAMSARTRDTQRVGEFAASLGGIPLRNAYRSIITR